MPKMQVEYLNPSVNAWNAPHDEGRVLVPNDKSEIGCVIKDRRGGLISLSLRGMVTALQFT